MKNIMALTVTALLLIGCGGGDSKQSYRLVEIITTVHAQSLTMRSTYAYNDAGYMVRFSGDNENDGVFDIVTNYYYDTNNRLIKFESDSNNDGTINLRRTYHYDANGKLTGSYYDSDIHDEMAGQTTSYTYNTNNQIIKSEVKDENGNPLGSVSFTYDDKGYIKTTEIDGNISTRSYEFDTEGMLQKRLHDISSDGIVDSTDTFKYEAGTCTIPEPVSFRKILCN